VTEYADGGVGRSNLLTVEHLRTSIGTQTGTVYAVDDVSFSVARGETLGIVGESGSGKSIMARSVLGMLPPYSVRSGRIDFDGRDLLTLRGRESEALWGKQIGMIFQDPSRSLNPVVRIGRQLTEGMRRHLGIGKSEATARAVQLLDDVGVPDPERRLRNYPIQMSGGMQQRVMIAIALSCEPALLIADEPTTALDVTIQRQILDLLERQCNARDMAMVLISHDLGMVLGRADKVAVMYSGRVMEYGGTAEVFEAPRHRYSEALLQATPSMSTARHSRLAVIEGTMPNPRNPPSGCRFASRCRHVQSDCRDPGPASLVIDDGTHQHACLHPHSARSFGRRKLEVS
jgi:peptide/nickel transport system ATP-binding protein